MFNIIIERECGCIRRANMQLKTTVDNKDDAAYISMEMCEDMNDDFCSKHRFEVIEVDNNFIITMKNT